MNQYIPNIYQKSIFDINYEKLKESKIKLLLFDIDSTIADSKTKVPSEDAKKLIKELKNDFKVLIISNASPMRTNRFSKSLGIDGYYLSCKPLSFQYKKIINKYGISVDNIAAIGDQLYTDVKGANKMNITSILVDRINNHEHIFTKINRLKENRLIKKYKVIERYKYYE